MRSLRRSASTSAAEPAVSAHRKAITTPTASNSPKPRTIGTGESPSTSIAPALAIPAVAIVGAPALAARLTATRALGRVGCLLGKGLLHARLELDRIVHRQPHQHRQHRNLSHRQRRPHDRQRAERERGGEQRDRERQAAAAARGRSG